MVCALIVGVDCDVAFVLLWRLLLLSHCLSFDVMLLFVDFFI